MKQEEGEKYMFLIFLAAFLWGTTNPLLKRFTAGRQPTSSSLVELQQLLQRPKYLVCQALNLCGSIAFFAALREFDVSVASIATNSIAFLITVVVSSFALGERRMTVKQWIGVVLVLVGVSLCTSMR